MVVARRMLFASAVALGFGAPLLLPGAPHDHAVPPSPPGHPQALPPPHGPLMFGVDQGGVAWLQEHGLRPHLGTAWAGTWSQQDGWDHIRSVLLEMQERGVTPLVHWYYWGDDISPGCVQDGCWSELHSAWKTQAGWRLGAAQLGALLAETLQGREAVVVLETEFNKGGIATWEPFDGLLADVAGILRAHAPGVTLVLGFGNWGQEEWHRFDRAASAVDLLGLQTLRATTRDDAAAYLGAGEALEEGVRALHRNFGKGVLVHDLGLSSHPGPWGEARQAQALRDVLGRVEGLQASGLEGVVYRAVHDDPSADTRNHFGVAERAFGLLRADGSAKPAAALWLRTMSGSPPSVVEHTAELAELPPPHPAPPSAPAPGLQEAASGPAQRGDAMAGQGPLPMDAEAAGAVPGGPPSRDVPFAPSSGGEPRAEGRLRSLHALGL